ncbi:Ig-like domain-containing protein [Candidatus Palauibacter sp.]|uniref:Ig-like domain-containing protein n=1 Tax=Candidatus Palauibacter sp. TaxID=3101350 RepID=UPI003B59F508
MKLGPHSRINGGSLKVAAALVAIAACDSGEMTGPVPGVPASVAVAPDSAVLTYLGETAQFTARVTDGTGASVGGAVRWESTDGAVVSVDGTGLVTARGNGTAEVRASAGGASDASAVVVEQRAATLRVFGDGQSALAGLSLPASVGVAVLDAGDRPVVGTAVRFAVTSGGGSADPDSAVSDGSGVASAVWTLGVAPGEQRLVVSAATGPEAAITALAVDPNSVVARVVPWSGDGQWGLVGQPLPEPVVVQALDEAGRPVPGALMSFVPEPGDGSVEPKSARSDSAGLARAEWTLGPAPGEQALSVAVAGQTLLEVAATAQPDAGVCGRTRAVIEELLVRTGTASCENVTEEQLASIVYLTVDQKNIRSLRRGDFAGLSGLRLLFLRKNRLTTLPADILAGLDSLAVLDLGQNQLESLPPGMLEGLTRLTDLSLLNNRLTQIPSGLAVLTRLKRLNLGYNPWSELPSDLFAQMRELEDLRLYGVGLKEIPPGIFDGLSALMSLGLGWNRLFQLREGAFGDLWRLSELSLIGNELTDLPLGTFADLRALEFLDLARNKLDRLEPSVFSGLFRLRALHLYNNELSMLPSGLFERLSNLESLRLERNALEVLSPDIFEGLHGLRGLRLNGNALSELPPDVFAGLGALETLSLWGNRLSTLPPDIFRGLGNLAELDLASNELRALPPGIFAGLSNLERLDLRPNPGAPFPVRLDLKRTDAADALAPGPASVVLHVPSGAPFSLEVPVTAQRGTASSGSFAMAAGDTVSAALTVSRSAATGPVHVSLGLPPALSSDFPGLEYVVGEQMVLFAPSRNRTPVVAKEFPLHWLQAGARGAEVELGGHFSDPDGDALVYAARSNDTGVVEAQVEGGVLELQPLAEGSALVEVAAEDPGGLRASLSIPVTVARAPDPDGYQIELIFRDGGTEAERFTEAEKAIVRRAAARWEEVVTGDLPDVPFDDVFCMRDGEPRLAGTIDDLMIQVSIQRQGGGILASAGTCGYRHSDRPFMGGIRFNRDYYGPDAPPTGPDNLYDTALHEMGHVLGIGGRGWNDLLRDRTYGIPLDTHFPGPLAVEAFNEAGGRPYAGGKVPAENDIRRGANFHWRTDVLGGELMAAGGGTALSAITLQALADLGYEVDVSGADPYELYQPDNVPTADAVSEQASWFADDLIKGSIFIVDENGNVVRVIRN